MNTQPLTKEEITDLEKRYSFGDVTTPSKSNSVTLNKPNVKLTPEEVEQYSKHADYLEKNPDLIPTQTSADQGREMAKEDGILDRFVDNMSEDWKKRWQATTDIVMETGPYEERGLGGPKGEFVSDFYQPQAPSLRQTVGVAGTAAGLGWDTVGNVLKLAADGTSIVIPDSLEEPAKQKVREAVNFAFNTPVGTMALELAQKGSKKWYEFKTEFPDHALMIESVVNVTPMLSRGPKTAPVATNEGTFIKEINRYSHKDRQLKNYTKREKGIFAAIEDPLKTDAQIAERRIDPGFSLNRTIGQLLTDQEDEMIKAVAKYTRVSPDKLNVTNRNLLLKADFKLAKRIETLAKKDKRVLPSSTVAEQIKTKMLDEFSTDGIPKNITKDLNEAMSYLKTLLDKNPSTASGILQARKEFDQWINRGEFKTKIFGDAKKGKPSNPQLSRAVLTMRQGVNSVVDSGNKQISNLLREEHLLKKAQHNIDHKPLEETKLLKRISANIFATGTKAPTTFTGGAALALNFGTLGLFGVALVTGKAIKLSATGAYDKVTYIKELRQILDPIEKAIDRTVNPSMKGALRADRAAVIELYKSKMEQRELELKEEEEPTKQTVKTPTKRTQQPGMTAPFTLTNQSVSF
tara:strand:- start:1409 stop:3307 length:1899 start_codon:yes stop_codon:yes gene_type:complete